LRHRRRNNTQKILRQSTGTYTKFSSPKKKKTKKPLIYFFSIVVVGVLLYHYSTDLSTLFNSFIDNTSGKINILNSEKPVANNPQQTLPVDKTETPQYYSPIDKKIQLEILNGCGESGVAKKLSDLLKKSNYDIVNSGNYMQRGKVNWDVNESKIIDQVNKQNEARKLADLMGILYSNVETFENSSPIADLTIVIGKDYKTLAIFQ
jgi:hypothetical protein